MQSQQAGSALAQDMRQLSSSPDSFVMTTTSTHNAMPTLYRLEITPSAQRATIFVYRVTFSKVHAQNSPDGGGEDSRIYSKSTQRALMPLVFDALGSYLDDATTNGSDRIFSTRALLAVDFGFEVDAPRGLGGRVRVAVEPVDDSMVPRATIGPEASSMSENQFQFLASAMQTFARAQAWEAKARRDVGGWRLVGKHRYFDATPEHCLGYGPFQVRRGVEVSLMRDQCLLKLVPLSHTFLLEGNFVEFIERLVTPGENRAVPSIPSDVMEYIQKVFPGLKVRNGYVSAGQGENGESYNADKLQSWEVRTEGTLHHICAFGGNARDTKFQRIPRTAGEEEVTLSVQEYFENHVFPGTKLRFPKWPLANTGTIDEPTWVPLELLWIEADQIVDELPQRFPFVVSRLFDEKHAENIVAFEPTSSNNPLKLDQVTSRYGIKLEEVRSGKTMVPDRPIASLKGIRQIHDSHDLRLLHVEGASVAEDDWDCGATFGRFISALNTFGALESKGSDHVPVCNYITSSQLSPRALSRFTATPNKQDDKKPLLFACLSGEKQERDQAYQDIKKWGDAAQVPTIVVQAQKFREHMDAWSKDLSRPSDRKRRAAVGYARSMSKKIRASCGCDGQATQRKPKNFLKDDMVALSEGLTEDVDVPVLRLLP